jgi:type I restriction enzyme R subunit
MNSKKHLSERDICTRFITPALQDSGWDIRRQIREEVSFTAGRIILKGKLAARGKKKRADYILYHKPNLPIAIIEAKDNNHTMDAGIQQALDYAEHLDIPFVYSSNGDGFIEHDRTLTAGQIEKELSLEEFPSPEDLWNRFKNRYRVSDDIEPIITQDYFYDPSGKEPRYYQRVAINRTIDAISRGENAPLTPFPGERTAFYW